MVCLGSGKSRPYLLAGAVMRPLDLTEWAQSLRRASDSQIADFGLEILDLIDREPLADRYTELIELLERATEKTFDPPNPDRLPECWGGYVESLVKEKDERRDKLRERALRVNAANLPPALEYDL